MKNYFYKTILSSLVVSALGFVTFNLSLKALMELRGKTTDEKKTVSYERVQNEFMRDKNFSNEVFEKCFSLQNKTTSFNNDEIVEFSQNLHSIIEFLENEMNKFSIDFAA